MGAGKTSVGGELATLLDWQFVDLDSEIERATGTTVASIFETHGERHFRELERDHLLRICTDANASMVVSLGGGAFAHAGNAALIRSKRSIVVFLDAPVDELRRRIAPAASTRPLAADEQAFARLYAERRAAYQQADVTIDTLNKTIAQVAREIAQALGK